MTTASFVSAIRCRGGRGSACLLSAAVGSPCPNIRIRAPVGANEIRLYSHFGHDDYQRPPLARLSERSRDVWTVANAKARLSEVIERAQAGPQVITRNGKPSAIVVSVDEWTRKTARKGTLAEFLLNSPLRGAELELERLRDDDPRDLGL